MRWIALALFGFFIAACGDNAKDPAVSARTKYVQTALVVTKVNDTVIDAVRVGLIKPRSDAALKIDKARAVVRAAMDAWGDNPDSIPYMNAALAALPELIRLVEQFTGKKIASLEPRSAPWVPSAYCFSFSPWGSTSLAAVPA